MIFWISIVSLDLEEATVVTKAFEESIYFAKQMSPLNEMELIAKSLWND